MNKFLFSLTTALLFISTNNLGAFEVLAEAKAGYFGPTDKLFREIYSGGGIYGAEISAPIWCSLHAWGSASYFSKKGSSIGLSDPTRIQLVPLALGVKYLYSLCNYDLYAGAGVQYTHLKIKDDSPFVIKNITKWGVGGIVKIGTIVNFDNGLFLDIFADYSFLKMSFHDDDHDRVSRQDAKLDGFSVGVGLGYRFCL